MAIVGLEDDEIEQVKSSGIKRFTHFVTVPPEELKTALEAEGVKAGSVNDILAFQRWYGIWRSSKPAHGILIEFTENVWWEYLISLCSANESGSSASSIASFPAVIHGCYCVATR